MRETCRRVALGLLLSFTTGGESPGLSDACTGTRRPETHGTDSPRPSHSDSRVPPRSCPDLLPARYERHVHCSCLAGADNRQPARGHPLAGANKVRWLTRPPARNEGIASVRLLLARLHTK